MLRRGLSCSLRDGFREFSGVSGAKSDDVV
jgi:hypothetical protein